MSRVDVHDKPDLLQVGGDLPEHDQSGLDADHIVHRLHQVPDREQFLKTVGPRIRAMATRGGIGADSALIAACPALEIIAIYGVGFDAVDLDACRRRGIRVTNTPDVLTGDVADFGVALMLALLRDIPAGDSWVRDGSWVRHGKPPLTRRVYGSRVGMLGLGRIGCTIARRLVGFEASIGYCDLAPVKDAQANWCYFAGPVELAEWADVLLVTLAASRATRGIVNAELLSALGPHGYLVNISRGSNVNEDALLDALEQRAIAGAALDVFAGEPDINPRFLPLPNVVLQPHHASGTGETRAAMGQLMRDNLAAHFAGQPLLTPVI